MGCGSSTPVKTGVHMTSVASHRELRTRGSNQQQDLLNVGPDYEPVMHLGKGGTGDTWCFRHKPSGEEVAVKFIRRPLPKVLEKNITREFTIQADLGEGHQSVIKAYEAVLTPNYLCLVMEYAKGGSLTSYVANKWQEAQKKGLFLSEDEANYFFRQFISAVKYCHLHSVAHRDLKLDNTLLDNADPPCVKICDFGFAKTWSEDANMLTQIGTPVYMSPELINTKGGSRAYDGRSVDIWASGILLLVMLLGSFPFDHTEHPDPNTSEAHLEVWLQQVSKRWNEVPHMRQAIEKLSPECKDLLNRIFVIDAKKRISIDEIERHPWYRKQLPGKYQASLARLQQSKEQIDTYLAGRKASEASVLARTKQIESLVIQATHLPTEDEPSYTTINLRQSAVLDRLSTHGVSLTSRERV